MDVREAIRRGAAELYEAGVGEREEAAREAAILLSYCAGVDTARLYALREELAADVIGRFRVVLDRRRAREPLQYITGVQEFMSLQFRVDRRVLIPRPETEILVEAVLDFAARAGGRVCGRVWGHARDPGQPGEPPGGGSARRCADVTAQPVFRFADVGTGSGAIAVSIAKCVSEWARVEGYAADISEAALEVARENAAKHGVGGMIRFLHGNLLEPVARVVAPQVLDAVASNPPYIEPHALEALQPEVRLFEPVVALRCEDPVRMYQTIAVQAAALLREGGLLTVEVGAGQARSVAREFDRTGLYADTRVIQDLAGIERVVCCNRGSVAGNHLPVSCGDDLARRQGGLARRHLAPRPGAVGCTGKPVRDVT